MGLLIVLAISQMALAHSPIITETPLELPSDAPPVCSLKWLASESDNQTDDQICSGSLIDDRWILTAAHCLGRTWLHHPLEVACDQNGESEGMTPAAKRVVHSKAQIKENKKGYVIFYSKDLALIELEYAPAVVRPGRIAKNIQEIQALLNQGKCRVAGFGEDRQGELEKLNVGQAVWVENAKSSKLVGSPQNRYVGFRDMLVFSGVKAVLGGGDSGGPVFCQDQKSLKWVVVGVNSWSNDAFKDTKSKKRTLDNSYWAAASASLDDPWLLLMVGTKAKE